MPHFILEYSDNVHADFAALFKQCHQALVTGLPADLSHCYSRAIPCQTFCVADGAKDKGFVHAVLKIMPGRSQETLQAVGNNVLAVLKNAFADSAKKITLAISLDIIELRNDYYFKA